jgi:hypothetical protein
MMGGRQVNSRAYLSRFNFGGSDQNKSFNTFWWRVTVYDDFKRRRKRIAAR